MYWGGNNERLARSTLCRSRTLEFDFDVALVLCTGRSDQGREVDSTCMPRMERFDRQESGARGAEASATRPDRRLRLGGEALGGAVDGAVQEVQNDALAEAALADLEGLARRSESFFRRRTPGRKDVHPAGVELEAVSRPRPPGRRRGRGCRARGSRTQARRRPGGAAGGGAATATA